MNTRMHLAWASIAAVALIAASTQRGRPPQAARDLGSSGGQVEASSPAPSDDPSSIAHASYDELLASGAMKQATDRTASFDTSTVEDSPAVVLSVSPVLIGQPDAQPLNTARPRLPERTWNGRQVAHDEPAGLPADETGDEPAEQAAADADSAVADEVIELPVVDLLPAASDHEIGPPQFGTIDRDAAFPTAPAPEVHVDDVPVSRLVPVEPETEADTPSVAIEFEDGSRHDVPTALPVTEYYPQYAQPNDAPIYPQSAPVNLFLPDHLVAQEDAPVFADQIVPLPEADCAECCVRECWNVTAFAGIDYFHGRVDSEPENNRDSANYGNIIGLNVGLPVSHAWDVNVQLGATHGIYDWKGRNDSQTGGTVNGANPMHQTFITLGLFQNCDICAGNRISWALSYDWMTAVNYGFQSHDITLSQARGTIAYALDTWNQVGLFAAIGDRKDADGVGNRRHGYEAKDQIRVFWAHKFENTAESQVWFGLPESGHMDRTRQGSTVSWLAGMAFTAPLSDTWGLYGRAQYGHPSASSGPEATYDTFSQVGFGLIYTPGGRGRTICNSRLSPVLPVAENGSLLADRTNRGFL